MPEIKFETGIVSFKLNDAAEVSFNPTDSAFVEQIFNTFDELDRKRIRPKSTTARTRRRFSPLPAAATRKCGT